MIRFLLQNFTLTLFVPGFVAAAGSLLRKPHPLTLGVVVHAFLAYFILCSIALSYLYNFVARVFFGEMVARFVGWADSPFQREVGFASLGFAARESSANMTGATCRSAVVDDNPLEHGGGHG